ncbi:hypothetical protein JNW91_08595 [Micromonospora sp. STR1_7]|uniref:Uncharacterized protein n=1 Tax=Micromonospora parastrephiae TaxID=2806101 RepID=A0ABS1XRW6_9ACTN|nr:hypothetical protein [Micromonospora parastrephiae]MBM0231909.1 hypothetical protein [Micromonospora parastrephiae]
MADDPGFSAIVESYSYRLFVRGMRLALLFPVVAVLVVLAGFGVAPDILEPLTIVLFFVTVLGVLTGWVGAVFLVKDTSRYSGGASGNVDIQKSWNLMQQAIKDICNFRKW